jgi:glycosyltransferase involved in cell wall biosynthesis
VVSSRDEPFGLVTLEAMAAGIPVVAFDVGALSENIIEGETGYVVPPEDTSTMAERILGLLDSPAERRRLGHAGAEWVRRERSLDAYVDGVRSAHRAVIERALRPLG